jgi:hypothetical protein
MQDIICLLVLNCNQISSRATFTNLSANPLKGEATSRIVIANNEWAAGYLRKLTETTNPATGERSITSSLEPAKIFSTGHENSIKTFHEFRHAFLRIYKPQLSNVDHNTNVENFEKLMRGTYKVNGKAIGGTVIKH